MAFKDIIFPELISIGAVGGPGWKTDIVRTASGREQRNQVWEFPLSMFEVSHDARRDGDWQELVAFFNIVHGMADTFRFRDWTDYICLQGDGFFIDSLGSPTQKQMAKRYTIGGYSVDRIITKPVSGQITVAGGGTLDYSTGRSTGAPTAWHGQFHVHARLGVDEMKHDTLIRHQESDKLVVGWRNIPIYEVRDDE